MTLTFDIQTVKLIVWCRCPVDDVCQLASKSVRQTNDERTDGRTDTLRTYCLCLPGCPGGGIITDPGSYRQCIYDTACSMPDFKQLLTQSWTWVHFAKSNPTQSTSWLTQSNPRWPCVYRPTSNLIHCTRSGENTASCNTKKCFRYRSNMCS